MNIAEAAINADVARQLLLEAERAESDFLAYVFADGLKHPRGMTITQWREETVDSLLADAAVRLERAVVLLGVPGVQK